MTLRNSTRSTALPRQTRTGLSAWVCLCIGALGAALLAPVTAQAADGKLLLTGGVSSIDGAAGGGLTPWAVTGSLASDTEIGATAHLTQLQTQDYRLTTAGALLSVYDRVELSLSRQRFDTGPVGPALALGAATSAIRSTRASRSWRIVAWLLRPERQSPGPGGRTLSAARIASQLPTKPQTERGWLRSSTARPACLVMGRSASLKSQCVWLRHPKYSCSMNLWLAWGLRRPNGCWRSWST